MLVVLMPEEVTLKIYFYKQVMKRIVSFTLLLVK